MRNKFELWDLSPDAKIEKMSYCCTGLQKNPINSTCSIRVNGQGLSVAAHGGNKSYYKPAGILGVSLLFLCLSLVEPVETAARCFC